MYSFYFEQLGTYVNTSYTVDGLVQTDFHRLKFAAGTAMTGVMQIQEIGTTLRDSEVEYGLVPMPKWEESQQNYYCKSGITSVVIPANNSDLDFTGTILESMCYETWKSVIPAYYEVALKHKFLQSEMDVEMVEIVAASATTWAPYLYGHYTGLGGIIDHMLNKKQKDFASWYAAKESAAKKKLSDFDSFMKE